MLVLLVVPLVLSLTAGVSIYVQPETKLHDFMDDEELRFYFGSEINLPEYEIVDLPENLSSGRESVIDDGSVDDSDEKYVSFEVFNKQIKLNLYPNRNLISPYAKIVKKSNRSSTILNDEAAPLFCHYLHVDSSSTAAITNCVSKEIHGLLFLPDDTLEILPLNQRLKFLLNLRDSPGENTKDGTKLAKVPHLIKRSTFFEGNFENDFINSNFYKRILEVKQSRGVVYDQITVELGLFFDEAFYKFFSPFFDYDDEKLRNFIMSYINGMQSLYHHHSLGHKVDFTIVYLEIMEEQPVDMPHAYGERNALIDNFCQYQKSLNPIDDRNPSHWDIAVYVSGLDFFAWGTNGIKNGVTMGLATVGGVCNDDYNCVIAEFGSINQFGRPYPSSGYTAVYILAHEIGHNLGMSHDSSGNSCSKEGFVMSPSRGTQGETTWSSCSAAVIRKLDWAKCLYDKPSAPSKDLDPWKYSGYPGLSFTAKDQCEILLRDRDAYVFVNGRQSTVCDNLHCRTPNKPGFFFAGPALQGTECGYEKWCEGGTCVNRKIITTTTHKPKVPMWGSWKTSNCKSECIKYGKGYQVKRRFCNQPDLCIGPSLSVGLCNDSSLCSTKKSIMDYGTQKCKEFSRKVHSIDSSGFGLQASYDNLRLWMPCVIFCKRKNTSSYYTPRLELNDLGIDPYYPDGTLCHREQNENFYCIQHHCLPENTTLTKSPILPNENDEVPEDAFKF